MIDLHSLREAFGRFPTGVTVVTAQDDQKNNYGFTANSFTSVSLDPPLLLVCPGAHLSSRPIFDQTTHFAVNVLAEGQEEISTHFASFKGDRFADIKWQADPFGLPLIEGVAAQFSCRVFNRYEAGDHLVLIGEVLSFSQQELRGLGFLGGQYFNLGLERAPQRARSGHNFAGVILEDNGTIYLPAGELPIIKIEDGEAVRDALAKKLFSWGLDARIGGVYSLYDSDDGQSHHIFYRAQILNPLSNAKAAFVPIDQLENIQMKDHNCETMLKRFSKEYKHRNFGLYIGGETRGQVHETGEI